MTLQVSTRSLPRGSQPWPHFLHLQSAAESRPQVDFRDSVDPRGRRRRCLFRLHYVVQ